MLGLIIWRFKLIDLLSNVEEVRVIDKGKATRFAACYLFMLGACFITLGYFIERLTERNLVVIVACFIPINMVILVTYLLAQSRNMR